MYLEQENLMSNEQLKLFRHGQKINGVLYSLRLLYDLNIKLSYLKLLKGLKWLILDVFAEKINQDLFMFSNNPS